MNDETKAAVTAENGPKNASNLPFGAACGSSLACVWWGVIIFPSSSFLQTMAASSTGYMPSRKGAVESAPHHKTIARLLQALSTYAKPCSSSCMHSLADT